MAKVTAWLVTLIGVLMVWGLVPSLPQLSAALNAWIMALAVLVIGVTKLMRNYQAKRK